MGVRSRSKRRRRSGASASSADLISGLCDDVLLRILELLPDAADAVRTGALSRRWRGLWTRVGSLTFDFDSSRGGGRDLEFKRARNYKRFLAFVSNAIAQRDAAADGANLEHLAISFAIYSPVGDKATRLRCAEAAQQWIRYATATQGTTKSFVLKLQLLPTWRFYTWDDRLQQPLVDLSDVPASSANLETMHWELGRVRLHLPAAAAFPSLVDLSLQNIEIVAGSCHLLARLVSSACCPSLQKLQLRNLRLPKLNELLIEARELLELSMSNMTNYNVGAMTLELRTPSLRILHMDQNYAYHLGTIGISAPKLEELTFLIDQHANVVVDDELSCMRRLKIDLFSHRDEYNINNGSICLLRCCTSLTCLEVSVKVTKEKYVFTETISGRIPHLPHLISLTVHAYYLPDMHSFGVDLSEILKQCSYLKYLCIRCNQMGADRDHFLCKPLRPLAIPSYILG